MSEQISSLSQSVESGNAAHGTTPDTYRARFATLAFACAGADPTDETSWQTLMRFRGKSDRDNVGPVDFRYSLTVTQGTKKVSCSVKWKGLNLEGVRVSPGLEKRSDIVVQVECSGGVLEINGPEDEARQLPLAQHYESFRYLKLSLPQARLTSTGGTGFQDVADIVSHLRVHLTGDTTQNVRDLWHRINQEDLRALNAESEAEPKSPGEIQGCHAVTRRGMNDEVVLDVVEPKQGGEDDGFHYDHAVPDPSALTVRQKTPGVILPSKRPREVEEAVAVEQWMEDVIAERKAKQIFQDAQKEWNTARKKEQASSAKLFSVLEEKERLEEEEGRRKRQC